MPATCTFLLHQLSLLLLVGLLRLFVGSSPLGSPSFSSSSSSPDRSQFATAGPRGSPSTQEGSSWTAASWLLHAQKESLEPPVASSRVWDPAGHSSSSNPAIMSSQKIEEHSNTETRTSSSQTHNEDAFKTTVSGKERTSQLVTDNTFGSTAAIGTTALYTEMTRSGDLAQDFSSVMQTGKAEASPRTLDIDELKRVPWKRHSPQMSVSSISEDFSPATRSSYHTGLETTDNSSATVKGGEVRTSQFLTDQVTLTDPARTDLVSDMEITTSSDQTLSHTTPSRGRPTTTNATQFPDLYARTELTHSYLSPNTAVEDGDQPRSSTNTEKSISSSHRDTSPVSSLFNRGEERTLRTLRDIITSHNATQMSTTSGSGISSSSSLTDSPYMLTLLQTSGMNLSLGDIDFTEAARIHSQAPSETTAAEASGQLRSRSDAEKSISSLHPDSSPVSLLSDRGGARTLQTRTEISTSHNATQMFPISGSVISSSSGPTDSSHVLTPEQTSETNLSMVGTDFTEAALLDSQALSETTDLRSSQHTFSNFAVEKRTIQTERTLSSRSGDGALGSLSNKSKSTDATELSAFDLGGVSSSDLTHTSSVIAQSGSNIISSTEMDFTEPSKELLHTHLSKTSVYSSTAIDLSSTGSSNQPFEASDGERKVSSASTDSVYLSTIFTHSGERTLRSLPDNSTSPNSGENSTSNTEAAESSASTLTLISVTKTEERVSFSDIQFTEPSTERLLENSSAVSMYATSKDPSATGNYPNPGDISSTETRLLRSYTESIYSSAPLSPGEEEMLQTVINTTFTEVTESTSLYMEKSKATEQYPSPSEVYSQRTHFSVQDFDISGSSTETFQSLSSSRIPTYSSFQSEPSDTGTDYQLMSSTDTGKRTSASHTDSTYISTTFTRGGERTLLSISNNSPSESSTFHAEISSPSESVQSSFSVTQSRGSNISSTDGDFPVPSTKPLTVHYLKTPGYFSAVSEQHTTQSYSDSESKSASNLSFFSSPPTLPEQDLLPSTQAPILVSSSESSLPSSSSAFPSLLASPSTTALTTFSTRLSSTAPPTLPPFLSLLPSLSSTPPTLQPSGSFETSVSMTESEGTTGIDPSIGGSSHSEYDNQTRTYPSKVSTAVRSTDPSPHVTEPTEQLSTHSLPVTISLGETRSSRQQNLSFPGTSVEKTLLILTTSPTSLSEGATVSETSKATTSTFPNITIQKDGFSLVAVTTGKTLTEVTHATLELPTLASSTDYSVTTKPPKFQLPSSTKLSYTSAKPSTGMEASSATSTKVTGHIIHATHLPKMVSSSKTTTGPFPASPLPTKPTTVAQLGSPQTPPTFHGKANVCTPDTCLNNGKCTIDRLTGKFQCQCSSGWQGEDCSSDIDECLSNPCPASATCTNTHGSFQCMCSLGYQMEKGKCHLVRTFVGEFPLTFNTTGGKYSDLHQVEEDISNVLNNSLSTLPGYYTSTVKASRQSGTIQVSVLSTFSLVSNVTLFDIVSAVRSHIRACKAPTETCQFISNLTLLHRVGGLCKHKDPECDKETSVCVDLDGVAVCQCKAGYFKFNKLDHSCRACEDGYKLENDTCVSCPFGLGGFNCGNPYQLITIVIAAAGGGLLLIMGVALIVTCCQKNKNDISKLIFKSGDFQMSPYAEYPKNPRPQDWGRETIEMQENGSTKNLLQMTDVYYMPTNLRNPELERNGIYPPYTGLPGSRHSCIYPGQYNPSFISDDSRRRDYF